MFFVVTFLVSTFHIVTSVSSIAAIEKRPTWIKPFDETGAYHIGSSLIRRSLEHPRAESLEALRPWYLHHYAETHVQQLTFGIALVIEYLYPAHLSYGRSNAAVERLLAELLVVLAATRFACGASSASRPHSSL